MNNTTKTYKDQDGYTYCFRFDKFKVILELRKEEKGISKEKYVRELAEKIPCDYETVNGWKKGKSSPRDIETVHDLEDALGVTRNSLLYSKEKKLEDELKYSNNKNAELVIENSNLKDRLEQQENENKSSERNKYVFIEETNSFSLRYEGFSNLIDLLIGNFYEEGADEDVPSIYAEELSYILYDYLYKNTIAEMLGFNGKRSEVELEKYRKEHEDTTPEQDMKWIVEAITDSEGNKLYDDEGNITIKGLDLWKRFGEGTIYSDSDRAMIKVLTDNIIDKWDDFSCSFELLTVSIVYNNKEVRKYRYGNGFVKPDFEDRMELIKELLFVSNGNIGNYAFQNVERFYVNQFERELEVVYDLSKII